MMTTLKMTGIWIDGIEKIEVRETKKNEEKGCAQRGISIWTTQGEKVELFLQADKIERLEFKKPEESWLTPKVYKDKSMHEEE